MNMRIKANRLIYWLLLFNLLFLSFKTASATDCEYLIIDGEIIIDEAVYSTCELDMIEVIIQPDAKVRAVAEEVIRLKDGFQAQSGSYFNARIAHNPEIDTILAAHGSACSDCAHIHRSHGFLFGTKMDGSPYLTHWCPDTWNRTQIHTNPDNPSDNTNWTNTNPYYLPINDTDPTNGIDRAMVFFQVGHGVGVGNEIHLDALAGTADPQDMFIGDGDPASGQGGMRYFLNHSCRTFAHGPLCDGDYKCPGEFVSGTPDSPEHRNVYERWGSALNENLRMACGFSTNSNSWSNILSRFWELYSVEESSVLDAWLYHHAEVGNAIPLCITRGDEQFSNTPLAMDDRFTNFANTGGPKLYIAYLESDFSPADTTQESPSQMPPSKLPVFETSIDSAAQPFLARGDKIKFRNNVTGQEVDVQINRTSGAMTALGKRKKIGVDDSVLKDQQYIIFAEGFLKGQGWYTDGLKSPIIARKMIQKATMEGNQITKVADFQGDVMVVYRRTIDVKGHRIKVLGNGGRIRVHMNNDGTVINAFRVWRDIRSPMIDGHMVMVPVKSFEDAFEEANAQLESGWAYRLRDWEWGYKEESGNIYQSTMGIVYRFTFEPLKPEKEDIFPLQTIEVAGQE